MPRSPLLRYKRESCVLQKTKNWHREITQQIFPAEQNPWKSQLVESSLHTWRKSSDQKHLFVSQNKEKNFTQGGCSLSLCRLFILLSKAKCKWSQALELLNFYLCPPTELHMFNLAISSSSAALVLGEYAKFIRSASWLSCQALASWLRMQTDAERDWRVR